MKFPIEKSYFDYYSPKITQAFMGRPMILTHPRVKSGEERRVSARSAATLWRWSRRQEGVGEYGGRRWG
jgi:hypothetical protein